MGFHIQVNRENIAQARKAVWLKEAEPTETNGEWTDGSGLVDSGHHKHSSGLQSSPIANEYRFWLQGYPAGRYHTLSWCSRGSHGYEWQNFAQLASWAKHLLGECALSHAHGLLGFVDRESSSMGNWSICCWLEGFTNPTSPLYSCPHAKCAGCE